MDGHRRRRIGASGRVAVLVGAAAALLLAAAACGDASTDSGGGGDFDADPAGPAVEVEDFTFTPADLTVPTGATVAWTFQDSAEHDVVADDSSFSSSLLNDGETYQFTFNTPGNYPYSCSVHRT